ncbi:hypothetical protein P9C69_07020 [Bacillus subtilis]|nr:hypothetical protein [Bacillus mojavensis]MEC1430491.1 hypothetical protein [Bacillus subtilis]MEC1669736.1 hypothetical protein [Bacillus mojavensis]
MASELNGTQRQVVWGYKHLGLVPNSKKTRNSWSAILIQKNNYFKNKENSLELITDKLNEIISSDWSKIDLCRNTRRL